MKKLITLLFILLICNSGYAIQPTYLLTAKNFVLEDTLSGTQNMLKFDIYLQWTNQGISDPFNYGACQYSLTFNAAAIAGQTWTGSKIASDLPSSLQSTLTIGAATPRIRLAGNLPGPIFQVNPVYPGTRIVRIRIVTNLISFPTHDFGIVWKDSGGGFVSRLSYLDPDGTVVFITNPSLHFVENLIGPQLIYPALNSEDIPLENSFAWRKAFNAVTYNLKVSSDSLFNNLIYNDSTLTDTSKNINGLSYLTKYFWKVTSKDSTGFTASSPVWYFTTLPHPSPQLIYPGLNSENIPLENSFTWRKVFSAITYKLQISSDSLFNNLIYNDSTLTDTSKNINGLSYLTKYFWKVTSKDSTGFTASSPVWYFTTTASPLIRINLTVLMEGKYYNLFNLLSKRDSVTVYLRNSTSPYLLIDSSTQIIDSTTFSNIFSFAGHPSGIYYIITKHYQCVETWSKSGGETLVGDSSIYNYNFTTTQTQAFGNNLKLKGSKYCLYSGDLDNDGIVDVSDLLSVYNDQTHIVTGNVATDINGDYIVDASDLINVYNNMVSIARIRRP